MLIFVLNKHHKINIVIPVLKDSYKLLLSSGAGLVFILYHLLTQLFK